MAGSVYGGLATANELIAEACDACVFDDIPEWRFSCAADAVARADLDEANVILMEIDAAVKEQAVLTPLRNARQLIVALQEDWSQ